MNYLLIGKRIKEIRMQRGYTQLQLAQDLSCSQKHIGNIERGNSRPSLECLHDISLVLNVSLDYLVSENASYATIDEHSKLVVMVDRFIEEKEMEFQQFRQILQQCLNQQ